MTAGQAVQTDHDCPEEPTRHTIIARPLRKPSMAGLVCPLSGFNELDWVKILNDFLQLLQGILSSFNPEDLLTGPDPSLGTQVWVYDSSQPAPVHQGDPDQRFIDLTDPANQDPTKPTVGAGFGNPANKYSWSSAIYDGELYVGTFNVFLDFRGLLAAYLRISQAEKVGALEDTNLFGLLTNSPFFPTVLDSQGGEIWKYTPGTPGDPGSAGGSWSQVYDAADVPELGSDVTGFRSMVVFGDKLYAASSSSLIFDLLAVNQDQPATISVYDKATDTWSRLSGGPLDNSNNASIRTMKVVGSTLLIGTENSVDGAQLWGLSTDGAWTQFTNLPSFTFTDIPGPDLTNLFGTEPVKPAATGDIVNLEEFGLSGKFLVGTWQPYGLYMGDINNPGSNYVPIILPGSALLTGVPPSGGIDNGVMRMEIYNGYLYVGSVNYTGGTSLFRISIESLKQIDTLEEANLSLLDPNFATLYATSGWEIITSNGFRSINPNIIGRSAVEDAVKAGGSSSTNGISTYSWSMKVITGSDGKQRLYVGDYSSTAGTSRLYSILDEGIAGTEANNFSLLSDPFKDDSTNTVTISLVTDQFGPEAYGLRTMQAYSPAAGLGLQATNGAASTNLIIGDADPFDAEIGLLNRYDPTRKILVFGNGGSGGDGDDILFGSASKRRTIHGGAGEDIVIGFIKDDNLYGDDDQDVLIGGIGRDRLFGGKQSDLIWGDLPSLGPNSFTEGLLLQLRALLVQALDPLQPAITSNAALTTAIDQLTTSNPALLEIFGQLEPLGDNWGEDNSESLEELESRDYKVKDKHKVKDKQFNDVVYGDEGEDILIGGLGRDKLYGGADGDVLIGQAGYDDLYGEDGADQLEGGRGCDKYYGGRGADIYDLRILDADSNLVPDGEQDTIFFRKVDFDPMMTIMEKVFGFESGIDKVNINKKLNAGVVLDGVKATITYGGSIVELVKSDPSASAWIIGDFVF